MQNTAMHNALRELKEKYRNKGGYDLKIPEMMELGAMSANDLFGTISVSFDYGFIKGIRYAKAMQKKRGNRS